eukprot:1460797-Karenia_brevis.AAC.1
MSPATRANCPPCSSRWGEWTGQLARVAGLIAPSPQGEVKSSSRVPKSPKTIAGPFLLISWAAL